MVQDWEHWLLSQGTLVQFPEPMWWLTIICTVQAIQYPLLTSTVSRHKHDECVYIYIYIWDWCHWRLLFFPLSPSLKGQELLFWILWPMLSSELLSDLRATFFWEHCTYKKANHSHLPRFPLPCPQDKRDFVWPGSQARQDWSIGIFVTIAT